MTRKAFLSVFVTNTEASQPAVAGHSREAEAKSSVHHTRASATNAGPPPARLQSSSVPIRIDGTLRRTEREIGHIRAKKCENALRSTLTRPLKPGSFDFGGRTDVPVPSFPIRSGGGRDGTSAPLEIPLSASPLSPADTTLLTATGRVIRDRNTLRWEQINFAWQSPDTRPQRLPAGPDWAFPSDATPHSFA